MCVSMLIMRDWLLKYVDYNRSEYTFRTSK